MMKCLVGIMWIVLALISVAEWSSPGCYSRIKLDSMMGRYGFEFHLGVVRVAFPKEFYTHLNMLGRIDRFVGYSSNLWIDDRRLSDTAGLGAPRMEEHDLGHSSPRSHSTEEYARKFKTTLASACLGHQQRVR
ncbi:unnamed protein product [Timema podura]|uniref:Uncharacterized protein n=1 Tax=Timema podura TaxID=61482 RepID=A0ABN7NSJ9_TIMPD|nr:unnamed protein product [Timema podura]